MGLMGPMGRMGPGSPMRPIGVLPLLLFLLPDAPGGSRGAVRGRALGRLRPLLPLGLLLLLGLVQDLLEPLPPAGHLLAQPTRRLAPLPTGLALAGRGRRPLGLQLLDVLGQQPPLDDPPDARRDEVDR